MLATASLMRRPLCAVGLLPAVGRYLSRGFAARDGRRLGQERGAGSQQSCVAARLGNARSTSDLWVVSRDSGSLRGEWA